MNKLPTVNGAERHDAVLSVLNLTGRIGCLKQVRSLTRLDGDAISHGFFERPRRGCGKCAQRCSVSSHVRIGRMGNAAVKRLRAASAKKRGRAEQ